MKIFIFVFVSTTESVYFIRPQNGSTGMNPRFSILSSNPHWRNFNVVNQFILRNLTRILFIYTTRKVRYFQNDCTPHSFSIHGKTSILHLYQVPLLVVGNLGPDVEGTEYTRTGVVLYEHHRGFGNSMDIIRTKVSATPSTQNTDNLVIDFSQPWPLVPLRRTTLSYFCPTS